MTAIDVQHVSETIFTIAFNQVVIRQKCVHSKSVNNRNNHIEFIAHSNDSQGDGQWQRLTFFSRRIKWPVGLWSGRVKISLSLYISQLWLSDWSAHPTTTTQYHFAYAFCVLPTIVYSQRRSLCPLIQVKCHDPNEIHKFMVF